MQSSYSEGRREKLNLTDVGEENLVVEKVTH